MAPVLNVPLLPKDERIYSPATAAEYLGVHINTIYRLIGDKRIPVAKIGARVFLPQSVVDTIMVIRPEGTVKATIYVEGEPTDG